MLQPEQIRQKPQVIRAIQLCLCAAFSCLIASAELGGIRMPLPTAFAAALPPFYALVTLAGSLFAYFLGGTLTQAPVLICALVLTVLARWVLGEHDQPALAAALAGAGTLISVVMFGFAGLVSGTDWILWSVSILVAAALAYCTARVRLCCALGLPLRLHGRDGLYCGVCYIAAIAALCSARIFLVSLGGVLIGFLVLAAAKRYHAVGGMVCGTLSACALLLSDGKTAGYAAMLGIAGMTAGVFSGWKKGGLLAVYQVLCSVGLLLADRSNAAALAWMNGMLGGLLFLFLPVTKIVDAVLQWTDADADLAALAGARLDFLSSSIAEVRGSAERIANMLSKTEPRYRPVERVSKLVCSSCRNHSECWEGDVEDAKRCFRGLAEAGLADAPELPEGCLNPERVIEEFHRVKKQNAAARSDAARLQEAQTLLFSQMHIAEELLRRAGRQVQRHYHREQSRYVADVLERFGVPVRAAAVTLSPKGRMTIELYLQAQEENDAALIVEYLQDMLQATLTLRDVSTSGGEQRILLQSTGGYEVMTAAAQCAVQEDEPCGDCWDTFSDSEGNVYLIISDGMGNGRRAAVDAKIVLSSFRQLVQSGMECEDAARMVNAIMLTKSGEERFATLDVAKIDTETAAVTLYKYGAGPTLLKHGDRVTLCQAATNPIGILPKAEPYTTVFKLEDGDLLFLLSDGLDDTLFPYIRQQLLNGGNLQALAHTVCAKAQRDAKGAPRDDVTVLAASITGAVELEPAYAE